LSENRKLFLRANFMWEENIKMAVKGETRESMAWNELLQNGFTLCESSISFLVSYRRGISWPM